jgi:voltage-gated potassium channel Kch
VLENVGLAHASCVVITFANPEVALRILRSVRACAPTCPILVRTQDDTKLEELQAAGATEVVPETFEASLMLLSHLLLLLKLPCAAGHPHRERHPQPSLRHAAPVLSRRRRRISG